MYFQLALLFTLFTLRNRNHPQATATGAPGLAAALCRDCTGWTSTFKTNRAWTKWKADSRQHEEKWWHYRGWPHSHEEIKIVTWRVLGRTIIFPSSFCEIKFEMINGQKTSLYLKPQWWAKMRYHCCVPESATSEKQCK